MNAHSSSAGSLDNTNPWRETQLLPHLSHSTPHPLHKARNRSAPGERTISSGKYRVILHEHNILTCSQCVLCPKRFWWFFFDHMNPASIPAPFVHPQYHTHNMSLSSKPLASKSRRRHHNGAPLKCPVTIDRNTAQAHQCGRIAAVNCDNGVCIHHCSYAPPCQLHSRPPGDNDLDADDVRAWLGDSGGISMDVDQAHDGDHVQDHQGMILPIPSPTPEQIEAREAMEMTMALAASLEPLATDLPSNSYDSATHQPFLNHPSSSSYLHPSSTSAPPFDSALESTTTIFRSNATSVPALALRTPTPRLVESSADRAQARAPPQLSLDSGDAPIPTLNPRLSQHGVSNFKSAMRLARRRWLLIPLRKRYRSALPTSSF